MDDFGMREEIQYDPQGRMLYHPDFHEKSGKPFTEEELEYLCKFYETDGRQMMSFALGRTEAAIGEKFNKLKKQGRFDYYKNLNKFW